MSKYYILVIDQGTTSSRVIAFDEDFQITTCEQKEFPQIYPQDGWVEHDPDIIWSDIHTLCKKVIHTIHSQGGKILSIGITNQRETTVIWNRKTGKPIYNAIVWQDRRTSALCNNLIKEGYESAVQQKTGLLIDSYFSATKISWILKYVKGAREQAHNGDLAFGTMDCYLLWKLTNGRMHLTDVTNASRTMLFNIKTLQWDKTLLDIFSIPPALLPEVRKNIDNFGFVNIGLFDYQVPICAMIGDQQSSAVGHGCFQSFSIKSTYGTGCFILLNTGNNIIHSQHKLLTTIAYQVGDNLSYALEGSIFNAGTAIQWLRDNVEFFNKSSDIETLIEGADQDDNPVFVPAFTGLGAPYWASEARGAIFGLKRSTTKAEISKAALEAVAFQTLDLLLTFQKDLKHYGLKNQIRKLQVDGGMIGNKWFLRFLSDILNLEIKPAILKETTALGAAYLAGLAQNFYPNFNGFQQVIQKEKCYTPQKNRTIFLQKYKNWKKAVNAVLKYSQ